MTKLLIWSTFLLALISCNIKPKYELQHQTLTDNATIISLAYPEEVVRVTEGIYSSLLPYIGMGIPGRIRAGHACMIIVKDGSETFEYFDFGRYITPEGFSRARGANTDPETTVDIKAIWKDGKLQNTEELLQWLYDHPEKTRGYGDLYASVSEHINYERVKEYIHLVQKQGMLSYGPFDTNGSNCARFVTDALYYGATDPKALNRIEEEYRLTPSGLGNVDAGNTHGSYYVVNEDSVFTDNQDLDELQRDIIVDWGEGEGYTSHDSDEGGLTPYDEITAQGDWTWLGGIGYGAWYEIAPTSTPNVYFVSQYNAQGKQKYATLFQSTKPIDLKKFKITYPSHFAFTTLSNDSETIRLQKLPEAKRFMKEELYVQQLP